MGTEKEGTDCGEGGPINSTSYAEHLSPLCASSSESGQCLLCLPAAALCSLTSVEVGALPSHPESLADFPPLGSASPPLLSFLQGPCFCLSVDSGGTVVIGCPALAPPCGLEVRNPSPWQSPFLPQAPSVGPGLTRSVSQVRLWVCPRPQSQRSSTSLISTFPELTVYAVSRRAGQGQGHQGLRGVRPPDIQDGRDSGCYLAHLPPSRPGDWGPGQVASRCYQPTPAIPPS